ncbi:unnamed protein product, partial [Ectocarpus sp. 12 AP-2014]
PRQYDNDACYEGDAENHRRSSEHSSDSDLGSCRSGSSREVKYDGKSKRQARRRRKMRRNAENKRGVRIQTAEAGVPKVQRRGQGQAGQVKDVQQGRGEP